MPAHTYSVARAQSRLPKLLRDAEAGKVVGINRRDETIAYILSRAQLESLVETMELLANQGAMNAISAHRRGKTRFVSLSSLGKE